ncbi:TraB/GumN family protein [Sphingobium sp. AN641]|uniref:TraB/GumN family protein n=1 Tax=Sphingobium sp. AN641 TaxID=3133443 RepID=UPI0030C1123C
MRKAISGGLSAVAALLLMGGGASAREARPADASVASPALWMARDADTTIYLFGTVHVLKPGVRWFEGAVKHAFDRSEELVLEIIEPESPAAMAAIIGTRAIATDGVALSERLEPAGREGYKAAMTANGLPWQSFETMEPWMAGMALSVAPLERLGYRSDLGVEKMLATAARTAGKRVGALETPEQQIGYFDTLPMAQQLSFLTATVTGLPDVERDFAMLIGHWASGEPDALAAEMNESLEATPELAKVLLYDRNARWAQWIKARMARPGVVFVAVGAGHLAGKGSVQAQMTALGVTSERVRK